MVDRIKKIKKAVIKAVKKVVKGEHEFKGSLLFDVWYPDHDERSVSGTFAATRRLLIESNAGVCWVCGIKDGLEAHHFHVEWAFASGVDWPKMKLLHPTFDWSEFNSPEDFVDSPYNMMILCEKHHRHRNHGIHNLPYPLFAMQKWQRSDFVFCSQDCCTGSGTTEY